MRFLKIPPRFLLPLMMFVGVLIVGVRAGDIWQAVSKGILFSPVQTVQAKEKTLPTHEETKNAPPVLTASDAPSAAAQEPVSPEQALFKQLSGRRDQLEARAKNLDMRESVIKVAEQRIDQKLTEMKTLQAQLQSLVGQASGAQSAQIENLVKIYEIMKPKEAARIFETLEMPILLQVIQRMKPARTASVMAEMDPLKAKEITVSLTQQDKLPQLK